MKKQNTLIALSVLSAMGLTAVSPIALNSFNNVSAVSAKQSSNQRPGVFSLVYFFPNPK